jgi:diguanylate cyclase (GGDEF)-like protein
MEECCVQSVHRVRSENPVHQSGDNWLKRAWPRFLLLAGLLATNLFAISLGAAQTSARLPVITLARAAHRLTMKDAAERYPVRLRATVTYYDPSPTPAHSILFVSDDSGGVFVLLAANSKIPLTAGDVVDVTGVSGPGNFAPVVDLATVEKISSGHLPDLAPRVGLTELLTAKYDSQWVELEGVVRAVRMTQRHIYLELKLRDGDITAMTFKRSDAENQAMARSLVDATITIRGVAGAMFNEQRQMTGAHLIFPGIEVIHVEDPPPSDPFAARVEGVDGLLHFSSISELQHRVHVQGTATLQWPGQLVCIDDHGHGLCAQTDLGPDIRRGQPVDLVGFPAIGAFTPTLLNATYRVGGAPTHNVRTPKGIAITAEQALGGSYDAQLVSIEAKLIGHDRAAREPTLVLSSGNSVFLATLPLKYASQDLALQEGSHLRVTGICSIISDGSRKDPHSGFPVPGAFQLLRGSPADVEVIEAPSWWNASHTMHALELALLVVVGAFCGVLILSQRVKRQTNMIRDSEERFRHLATHDSLTQLPNRASVLQALEQALQATRGNESSVCIALIDLDHFKQINDTLGHPAGDEVLRESARRLASSIRSTDAIGRYGGEEFLIVFRGMPPENGMARSEIMRRTLCEDPIRWEGRVLTITCSIGVAFSSGTDITLPALIAAADRAMYLAKAKGRNRVVSAHAELSNSPDESMPDYHPAISLPSHG